MLLTQDLDFAELLFHTQAGTPSVVLLRLRNELGGAGALISDHPMFQAFCQQIWPATESLADLTGGSRREAMKTTLTAAGEIGIPPEIRRHDHLEAGDEFDLGRVASGRYLLTRVQAKTRGFTIATADDGLPVIHVGSGVITSALVREIEGLTP